jgi:hypothetical protein
MKAHEQTRRPLFFVIFLWFLTWHELQIWSAPTTAAPWIFFSILMNNPSQSGLALRPPSADVMLGTPVLAAALQICFL